MVSGEKRFNEWSGTHSEMVWDECDGSHHAVCQTRFRQHGEVTSIMSIEEWITVNQQNTLIDYAMTFIPQSTHMWHVKRYC